MIKKIAVALVVLLLASSCVSKKVFNDLENKYTELKKENRRLMDEGEDCVKTKNELDLANSSLKSELDKTKSEPDKLLVDYNAADKNLKTLQASYKALEKNSDEALEANMNKN